VTEGMNMGRCLFESFKKYAADAESLEDFHDRYHHRKIRFYA